MEIKAPDIRTLCNAATTVLGGKFIALNAYIRKEERSKSSHLKSVPLRSQIKKSKLNSQQVEGKNKVKC